MVYSPPGSAACPLSTASSSAELQSQIPRSTQPTQPNVQFFNCFDRIVKTTCSAPFMSANNLRSRVSRRSRTPTTREGRKSEDRGRSEQNERDSQDQNRGPARERQIGEMRRRSPEAAQARDGGLRDGGEDRHILSRLERSTEVRRQRRD